MKKIILLFSLIILITSATNAQQLLGKTSNSVNISEDRLERLDVYIEDYINQQVIPGGVFLIARKGEIVYQKAFGKRSLESSNNYKTDDIFRIASMTKAITVTGILQLYEDGKLGLDDPVHYYLPAFKKMQILDQFNEQDSSFTTRPAKQAITIRHLLTHTSGIIYGDFDRGNMNIVYQKHGMSGVGLSHAEWTTEELVNKLAAVPLAFEPGERYTYGLNMEVLGRVIEVISDMPLDKYFQKNIFEPLGMKDTYFYLPNHKHQRLVPLYTSDENGKTIMVSGDAAQRMNYPLASGLNHFAGGGGLSSTAKDYFIFLQALLNNGQYNNQRILSRKTIETMTSDQIAHLNKTGKGFSSLPGITYCLGYALLLDEAQGYGPKSPGTFEWSGFFNTKYFVDPAEELIFVGMTQVVPFGRDDFWNRMYTIIYSSIEDE